MSVFAPRGHSDHNCFRFSGYRGLSVSPTISPNLSPHYCPRLSSFLSRFLPLYSLLRCLFLFLFSKFQFSTLHHYLSFQFPPLILPTEFLSFSLSLILPTLFTSISFFLHSSHPSIPCFPGNDKSVFLDSDHRFLSDILTFVSYSSILFFFYFLRFLWLLIFLRVVAPP